MKAVYERELASYFKSMIGYVFMFFIFLIVGIYFNAYNLSYAYPTMTVTLNSITFVFLIAIPILTMRVLSEERKQKTDQLLLTSPVSVSQIVCGKFFALMTVYAIPMLIICLYPLILRSFGTISYAQNYTAILGFFLLGVTNIAIGMFLSSLTESQIVAAVLTFVVMFVCYIMTGIESLFTDTAKTSFIVILFIVLAFAILLWVMTKNEVIAIGTGLVLEIATVVVYFVKSSLYEGLVTKILEMFNIDGHFQSFIDGTFDLTAVFYFISVAFVFVFLTIQSMNKRRWS
jgi:ABC-2 type transport system permease protein